MVLCQLAAIRKILGLSQAELGARTGLWQSYISSLERGMHATQDEHVDRIAAALGCSRETLTSRRVTVCSSATGAPFTIT